MLLTSSGIDVRGQIANGFLLREKYVPAVTVLSCPVCGAPLQQGDQRCTFCGSVVVIRTDLPRITPDQLNRAVVNEHIAEYRATVRRDNNDETAHYGLGVAYYNLGLLDEAADELRHAARLMPENPHIQTQLAVVYAELVTKGRAGALKHARDRLERALLIDPRHAEALILKARLFARRQEWDKATAVLREAAQVEPEHARPKLALALLGKAHLHLRDRKWQEGASAMLEAAELDPDRARPDLLAFLQANANLLDDLALRHLTAGSPDGTPQPSRSSFVRGFVVTLQAALGGCLLLAVVGAVVNADQGSSGNSGPATWLAWLALVAGGVGLAALVVRDFRRWREPRNREPRGGWAKSSPNQAERKQLRHELLSTETSDVKQFGDIVSYVAAERERREAAWSQSRKT